MGTRASGHDVALFGRDQELRTLEVAREMALSGSGRIVSIVGPAGIGKSALLQSFAARAADLGDVVLWGRCWEGEGAPPYWPWIQVLRGLRFALANEWVAKAGADLELVGRIAPEVMDPQDSRGGQSLGSLGDGPTRFRTLDAITRVLAAAAELRPLVILLDDLHRADLSSLDVLRHVEPAVGTQRMVVVTARRPEDRQAIDVGQRVDLHGLSRQQTAALLARWRDADPSADEVDRIHALSDGNPFLISELAVTPPGQGDIPDSVLGRLEERVRGLDRAARALLFAGSLLGPEFSEFVAAAVAGLEDEQGHAAVSALQHAGLVQPSSTGPGRLGFAHELVRATVQRLIAEDDRRSLHLAAADVLEERAGSSAGAHAAEIASHRVRALPDGDLGEAIAALEVAAAYAAGRLAHADALGHLRAGLDLVELDPVFAAVRLRLLLSLGDQQVHGTEAAGAMDTYVAAASLARDLHRPVEFAKAAIGCCQAQIRAPGSNLQTIEVTPLLEEALEALAGSAEEPDVLMAEVAANLAINLAFRGISPDAPAAARRAVELAERTCDARVMGLAAVAVRARGA